MVETADIGLECAAAVADDVARRFVRRWCDPRTVRIADDLAQQAALAALGSRHLLNDPTRLPGLVRTIVRRLRHRALVRANDRELLASDVDAHILDVPAPRPPDARAVCVRGLWIECERLLPLLELALARLTPLNERLLREFYGGDSCRVLAIRHRLTVDTVKVRLHRGRRRVRALMERQVSALAW